MQTLMLTKISKQLWVLRPCDIEIYVDNCLLLQARESALLQERLQLEQGDSSGGGARDQDTGSEEESESWVEQSIY